MSDTTDTAPAQPLAHTMTLAQINAFLKQQQAQGLPTATAAPAAETDKPKRGRPAKAETEAE